MKTIIEFLNESLRLDEAKKIKINDILKNVDKIEKWCSASNIKKLISEYMSAGDAEDLDKKHWDVCEEIVLAVCGTIRAYLDDDFDDDSIDIKDLADSVVSAYEETAYDSMKEWAENDPSTDWEDIDEICNLFNTVSMKVCKEAWLI